MDAGFELSALSPLDGRYFKITKELTSYFSESALIRRRVYIEVQYLLSLLEIGGIKEKFGELSGDFKKISELSDVSDEDISLIKEIEEKGHVGLEISATRHDLKAVEYYLRLKLKKIGLERICPLVHFALTSEDINNISYALMVGEAVNEILVPELKLVLANIEELALLEKDTVLLSRTHGQTASPSTFGKEMIVFASRLNRQINRLCSFTLQVKFSGATGTFAAWKHSLEDVDWINFSQKFVEKLSSTNGNYLKMGIYNTQIESHDSLCEIFDVFVRANSILLDFCQDMWRYISDGILIQAIEAGSVGSSTMPHKVNPVNFENAEGNLGISNSLFSFFGKKLPVSRLQRDLSDSTVLRNIGVSFGHSLTAYKNVSKGISKVCVNREFCKKQVLAAPEVICEAIQTKLRLEGKPDAYELLKTYSQGKTIDLDNLRRFILNLDVPLKCKEELLLLYPENYVGLSCELVERYFSSKKSSRDSDEKITSNHFSSEIFKKVEKLKIKEGYLSLKQKAYSQVKDILPPPALNFEISNFDYEVLEEKEAVHLKISDSQIIIVGGAFYGDEGKGKWGNVLSKYCDFVVRANSGANTGRTVYLEGQKFVFHIIPSAIVHGKKCYVGPEVVCDPISLFDEELSALSSKEISYDNLSLGNFHITTPYHRIMDVIGSKNNSSTGVGIKASHACMKMKRSLRLDHIYNSPNFVVSILRKNIENYLGFLFVKEINLKNVYEKLLEVRKKNQRVVPMHVLNCAKVHYEEGLEKALLWLYNLYKERVVLNSFFPRTCDVSYEISLELKKGKRLLLEGTQSYFLSNNVFQGFANATSADTTSMGVLSASGIDGSSHKVVSFSVHKYPGSTRVGRGNIPSSFTDQTRFSSQGITSIFELGNACNNFDEIHKRYFGLINDSGILEPGMYHDKGVVGFDEKQEPNSSLTGFGKSYEIGEAMAICSSRNLKERGATTGKPRICGWFDCVSAYQQTLAQGKNLFISAFDRGSDYNDVGLIIAYVVSLPKESEGEVCEDEKGSYLVSGGKKYRTGDIINCGDALPESFVLEYCLPIIRKFKGWKGKEMNYLTKSIPIEVSKVLNAIEFYTEARVLGIGVGPEDHQAIYLKRI